MEFSILALVVSQIGIAASLYFVRLNSIRLERFVLEKMDTFEFRLERLKIDILNAGGSFGETRMRNELRTVVSTLTGGISQYAADVSFMKEQIKEFRSEIDRIQFSSSGVEKPNGIDSSPTIF